jgi:hypothetical protein
LKEFRFSTACIPFVLVFGLASTAHAQEPAPGEWSLGAGIATTPILPYGGLIPLGTLSLERAVGTDFALIVTAGGTYQRTDGDFDDSKLAFGRLGVGARAFLTPPSGVRGSAYVTVQGEYAYVDEDFMGGAAELGGSVDAQISDNVVFRVGAGLVRASRNQDFDGDGQSTLVAGILPQAELRATF